MSRTIFIADIHLCQEEPVVVAAFLDFLLSLLQGENRTDALYILGDLFDAWIGDDPGHSDPLHGRIRTALRALPFPVYFIHGNRDFLLCKAYAHASGMMLLQEKHVLTLYGKRLLIMHGDVLCTDDKNYQIFRKFVRKAWIQKIFLALPYKLRKGASKYLRSRSKKAGTSKPSVIMDVNDKAVESVLHEYQAQWLIHGHTHRPGVQQVSLGNRQSERVTLGSWETEGSFVQVDKQGVTLCYFPLYRNTSNS